MELRTVTAFVTVVEAGGVTAAADLLRVAQPALSRQVRQLERDLGVTLFDRTGGRLTLTAAGHRLLPVARDLVATASAFRVAGQIIAEGRLAAVTIAAPTTTLSDVVAPFIATLRPEDPIPSVFTSDELSAVEALRRGADIAVTHRRPPGSTTGPALAAIPLSVAPVWAYVPPGHRWVGRRSVDLADLFEDPVVTLPTYITARQALDAAADRRGLSPAALVEAGTGVVAQALAAAGRGAAVVSDDPRFGLRPLAIRTGAGTDEILEVHLYAVCNPHHPAGAALVRLAERLRDYVRERYPTPVPR
ncbi:LysR family transcriptional regulator [Kineococcus gynurae]|uniref:LysR family transcriptional regulator n=1 Tax=Kineococcus gynurae TaxID=452979 RepID=A0ABV5LN32_9ACTN